MADPDFKGGAFYWRRYKVCGRKI